MAIRRVGPEWRYPVIVDNIIPSPDPAYFDWNGRRWYRNRRDGYYRDRKGELLHRAVWSAEHGPIPDGYEVHHKDHVRSHNQLANLRLLTQAEHRRYHATEHASDEFLEQQQPKVVGARTRKMWAEREPRDVVCAWCGITFQSTGMRARFCRPAHSVYWHRRERRARERNADL